MNEVGHLDKASVMLEYKLSIHYFLYYFSMDVEGCLGLVKVVDMCE